VLRLLLDRSHQSRLLEVGRYQAHEQSRRVLLPRWRLEWLSFSVSSLQVSSFVVLVLLVALPLQLPPFHRHLQRGSSSASWQLVSLLALLVLPLPLHLPPLLCRAWLL